MPSAMTALLCPCTLIMEAFILALRLSPRLSGYRFFHSPHERCPTFRDFRKESATDSHCVETWWRVPKARVDRALLPAGSYILPTAGAYQVTAVSTILTCPWKRARPPPRQPRSGDIV